MFAKPNTPTQATLTTAFGVFFAALLAYILLQSPQLLRGDYYINWSLVRLLALIGLLTVGVSVVENRKVLG